ncbi:c-type cytochrome [Paracoccus cavernae]|uniref:c-type cytochrome n=1 Tax=Paracoccus cavernae TaxID=1571207 RepID=UPI0035F34EC6
MSRKPALFAALAALVSALLAAGYVLRDAPRIRQGAALYQSHCASCHGADLEGQPDWQIPDDNGILPAPPHDASGHTWHHGDAMLRDYIRLGGQAVLDDLGANSRSGMPAFGETLSAEEIDAILAFIKSGWPADLRRHQAKASRPN